MRWRSMRRPAGRERSNLVTSPTSRETIVEMKQRGKSPRVELEQKHCRPPQHHNLTPCRRERSNLVTSPTSRETIVEMKQRGKSPRVELEQKHCRPPQHHSLTPCRRRCWPWLDRTWTSS